MALVFVSCGQHTADERKASAEVKSYLEGEGFDVFVALEAQILQDIDFGMIDKLRRSDYFLFIDFKREKLRCGGQYRGSLFTHQELALSYHLKFEKVIFLKHEKVKLEGIAQFLMANATEFSEFSEVLNKVQDLVKKHEWTPKYSRHLVVSTEGVYFHAKVLPYRDHTTGCSGRDDLVAFAEVENRRSDTAAIHTVAVLSELNRCEDGKWKKLKLHDQNRLKWAGHRKAYDCLIFPAPTPTEPSKEKFSLFALEKSNPTTVNLHSELDVDPREPIIDGVGEYRLTYKVYSITLPLLTFTVELHVAESLEKSKVDLLTSCDHPETYTG